MSSLSILILTKNEQLDLPDCLASVSWCDDVHVLDSESTDQTREIASKAGAHVTVRAFDGYASQRNAGLKLAFKHQWVLILDADERIPAVLADEMAAFVNAAPGNIAGAPYASSRYLVGTLVETCANLTFLCAPCACGARHYEREINEVLVVDGDIADLTQAFDHYPFSKGFRSLINKHNTYSRMEAHLVANRSYITPSWKTALFDRDFGERRVHQKAIFTVYQQDHSLNFFIC